MTTYRLWNIVLHRHEDATLTVRVRVDGHLLLPDCVSQPGPAILAYIEAALVDARVDDQLALRTQSSAGIRTFRAPNATSALSWLGDYLAALRPPASELG